MADKVLRSDNAVWLNIVAKRNDTFAGTIILRENGSLYQFATEFDSDKMQIKTSSEATTSILELTSAAGEISFGDSGNVSLSKVKESMDLDIGTYYYDIEFENSGTGIRETFFEGKFTITTDVTR